MVDICFGNILKNKIFLVRNDSKLFFGRVSEWPNEHAWKACVSLAGTVGSNPIPSAIIARKTLSSYCISMTTESSYENFLDALKQALIEKDTAKLDDVLQTMHGGWLEQDELDDLEEIISEATLYLELKDEEYREMALVLIREREEE